MALLTEFPLAEVQRVALDFDVKVSSVEPLAAGSVNSNFKVVTESGALLFARVYEEQQERGAIGELTAVTELAALGVPTPAPLKTRRGGYVGTYQGKPVSFYPWTPGRGLRQREVTPDIARQLGRELAGLHLASDRLSNIPAGRFDADAVARRLDFIDQSGDTFRAAVALIRSKQEMYLSKLSRLGALPEGIIHGDLFRDNALVDDGKLVALIDFESASLGTFVYDLMVCAHAWCFANAYDEQLVRGLFAGYLERRPLSELEAGGLIAQGALAALRFATTRITDFSMRTAPGQVPGRDYRRFLTRLEFLEAGALDGVFANLGLFAARERDS